MKLKNLAMIACLLVVTETAKAQFTAHCHCKIAPDQGPNSVGQVNPVTVDLGDLKTYSGVNPQSSGNQNDCKNVCASQANTSWQGNPAAVCSAFAQSKAPYLRAYAAVGTRNYDWCGSSIGEPAASNLPFNPRFYLLSVLYAVPGCSPTSGANGYNCGSKSSAIYANGSSASTTTSLQNSVTTGNNIAADASVKVFGIGLSGNASSQYSITSTTGSSATITKGSTTTLTENAITQDGINHDNDQFVLMLNPAVAVGKDCINGLRWNMGFTGTSMVLNQVSACQILGTCGPPMPSSVTNAKLTPSDWCAILSQDPWVPHCVTTPSTWPPPGSDLTVPDLTVNPATAYPGRYQPTAYEPPYDLPAGSASGGSCPAVFSQALMNSFQGTDTSTSQTQSTYSASLGASLSIIDIGTFGLKDTKSVTFTNSVSKANITANSQSATATIACAGAGWNNSYSQVAVYFDDIYSTFLFWPMPFSGMKLIHQGRAVDASGTFGAPNEPVQLSIGNVVYHTTTDRQGNYKIYSAVLQANSQPAKVTVGPVAVNVTLGSTPVTVKMPAACPNLSFSFQSRANSSVVNASLALTDKGPGSASNVQVTGITCTSGFVYTPQNGFLKVSFVVPGAANLAPNATTGFNTFFTRPGASLNAPFSCTINWTEGNGCKGAQVVNIP